MIIKNRLIKICGEDGTNVQSLITSEPRSPHSGSLEGAATTIDAVINKTTSTNISSFVIFVWFFFLQDLKKKDEKVCHFEFISLR